MEEAQRSTRAQGRADRRQHQQHHPAPATVLAAPLKTHQLSESKMHPCAGSVTSMPSGVRGGASMGLLLLPMNEASKLLFVQSSCTQRGGFGTSILSYRRSTCRGASPRLNNAR